MKKVFLLAIILIAFICFSFTTSPKLATGNGHYNTATKKTAGATPINFEGTEEVNFIQFTCNGEDVQVTGRQHFIVRGVINNNKITLIINVNYQNLKGIGLTTGNKYTGGGTATFSEQTNFNGVYENTHHYSFFLNTAGGNNDLKLSGSDKITINANGDVTVFHEDSKFDCQK